MIGSEDPEYMVSDEMVQNAQVEMFMYANELAAQRRNEPRDDIITALLDAEVDGDRLIEMDFNLFFLLISVAGNETTRNSISHGIKAFCDFPDQYQLLVDDPSIAPSATEEIVRWASPVMYFRRNVTRDTELRGQQIKEGDKVSIWYISANRDEDVFDRPFEFDVLRSPERARRVRRRWSAPLPRCQPRAHGDQRAARGDGQARPDDRADGRSRSRCGRTSSPASSTCR